MTKESTLEWRVKQLESHYCDLDEKIEKIMTNHLPHINEGMQNLKTRVSLGIGINVIMFAGTILGVILLLK